MLILKKSYEKCINTIFPNECIGCGIKSDYLCNNCKKELNPHVEICPICKKNNKGFKVCYDCKKNYNTDIEGIIIGFKYNGLLKKLILQLKYYHKKEIGIFLANRLKRAIITNESIGNINIFNSIITFIPAHRYRKYFIKGYNQSEIIANEIGKQLGLNTIQLCNKKKHTKSQTELSKFERKKNLINNFEINYNNCIYGIENIIIVDDITTTGSTINELAKCIKNKHPNAKIWGAVIGRH